jgi:hypothetical protein
MLRVMAGAGKDYELVEHLVDVLKAYNDLLPFVATAAYPDVGYGPMVNALREPDWRSQDSGTINQRRKIWRTGNGTAARPSAAPK